MTAVTSPPLPPPDVMFEAFTARDARLDGVFFTAVRTTGIFCRPSCPARRPRRENVEFFRSAQECLLAGYRPCLRCRPVDEGAPPGIQALLERLEREPGRRLTDGDLRGLGLEPASVRRWFHRHHGMTFHAFQRARRLGAALHALGVGRPVEVAAWDHGWESVSGFDEAVRRSTGRSAASSRAAAVVTVARLETPLGAMLAGATERGVCLLEFLDRRMLETQLARVRRVTRGVLAPGRTPLLDQLERELADYLGGSRRAFDVPLDLRGTPFQERVWSALRAIPYGETRSYAEQARAIGSPSATRAVARANGDNRCAIVVPCHRVIGADGALVGYGGGLWRKRALLQLEQGAPIAPADPAD